MKKLKSCYETKAKNGSTYRYEDDGNFVCLYVNGEHWGVPQGDRFIRALLDDINKLEEKNRELQEDCEFWQWNAENN